MKPEFPLFIIFDQGYLSKKLVDTRSGTAKEIEAVPFFTDRERAIAYMQGAKSDGEIQEITSDDHFKAFLLHLESANPGIFVCLNPPDATRNHPGQLLAPVAELLKDQEGGNT